MAGGRMWTTDEVRIMKAMYEKHGSDFASWEMKLDRTDNAIRVQARRMGLSRPLLLMQYEEGMLPINDKLRRTDGR